MSSNYDMEPLPPSPPWWPGIVAMLCWFAIVVIIILCMSSCALTVEADGRQEWRVSGYEIARAIIVLQQK